MSMGFFSYLRSRFQTIINESMVTYHRVQVEDCKGQSERYNVYSLDGKKLLTNAANLDGLTKGTYIINGEKKVLE